VLWVALKLGLTSFGGPIAHLGYYERTCVQERQWLSSEQYGGLISLCQLLPGPTSSQVGFLVGLHRAGWLGALAVWIGFTLPSALLMYAFALYAPAAPGPRMQAVLHGLMLTAVVVVAQAVWSMARSLAPDLPRRAIAVAAGVPLLFLHSGVAQLLTLVGGAILGSILCRSAPQAAARLPVGLRTRVAWAALVLFLVLLAGLSSTVLFEPHGPIALANIFYRSGAFVFGGGHVVLPLLQQALVPTRWISDDRFLAGYGFAQAMPGPLFTVAAYLGAAGAPPHQSLLWALIALIAIFLPGLLLAITGLSLLGRVANSKAVNAALAGINAAVVGLLAAALYNPVWVSAVHAPVDVAIVLVAFVLSLRFKVPPILIATLCVCASIVRSKVGL
jgi:chromate transporter